LSSTAATNKRQQSPKLLAGEKFASTKGYTYACVCVCAVAASIPTNAQSAHTQPHKQDTKETPLRVPAS